MESTDGRQEPLLVGAEAAARRALILRALLERHWCEEGLEAASDTSTDPGGPSAESYAGIAWDVIDILERHELWPFASKEESHLLQLPLSNWSEQDQINVSWRSEALVAILWALGVIDDMPPYDEQADLLILLATSDFFEVEPPGFVTEARLRDEDEIRQHRGIAEGWFWRARTYLLSHSEEESARASGTTIEAVIEEVARELADAGAFEVLEHDFPVKGKPYAQVDESEWAELQSLALERLHALNWICGHSDDWDNVPLDV